MTLIPVSAPTGVPGGPMMKVPAGGGAGGPGGRGVGRGVVGRGLGVVGPGPTGFAVVAPPPVPVGHVSQYHRFLQRFLQSWMVLPEQVVVGLFPHEVLYVFHSHFLTFFQQLLLLGGEANV